METMNEVLPRAGKKVMMDRDAKGVMPLLFPSEKAAAAVGGGAR